MRTLFSPARRATAALVAMVGGVAMYYPTPAAAAIEPNLVIIGGDSPDAIALEFFIPPRAR